MEKIIVSCIRYQPCPRCGKKEQAKKEFIIQVDPTNTNKNGEIKKYDQVEREVQAEMDSWRRTPVVCDDCKVEKEPDDTFTRVNDQFSIIHNENSCPRCVEIYTTDYHPRAEGVHEIEEMQTILYKGKYFEYCKECGLTRSKNDEYRFVLFRPCPFCGDVYQLEIHTDDDPLESKTIWCEVCGFHSPEDADVMKVIEHWNNRV